MSKKNKKKFLMIIGAVLIPLLTVIIYIYSSNTPGWGAGLLKPTEQTSASGAEPQNTGEENELQGAGNADKNEALNGEEKDGPEKKEDSETAGKDPEDGIGEDRIPLETGEPSTKREILFKGLEENIRIYNGCRADIRIRYANGEEYTVLKNVKLVVEESEETQGSKDTAGSGTSSRILGIFTELDELELLYYSSAVTDCVLYSETTLIPAIIKGPVGEDSTGNYRPVKEVLTLITEEGFMDTAEADVLFLARERLEERLLSSSVYYREAIKDALINGVTDQGAGYWLIN